MDIFDFLEQVLNQSFQRDLQQRVTDLEVAVGGDAGLQRLERSLKARARLAERKLLEFAQDMPGHHD